MIIKGISASPGVVIGPAVTISDIVKFETYKIKPSEIKKELIRLEVAIVTSKKQLHELQTSSDSHLIPEKADVFQTHMQLLEDPLLLSEIIQKIHEEPLNIETIIDVVFGNFIRKFSAMTDEYIKERAVDLVDVRDRLLKNLLGLPHASTNPIQNRETACIVVAKNLTPSQLVYMDKSRILGIAIEEGGTTSHVVLFARSLAIPTLVGVKDLMEVVINGETVVLDALNGTIETDVSKKKLTGYRKVIKLIEKDKVKLEVYRNLRGITIDKRRISLGMNIAFPAEAYQLKAFGAERVGLYRTEFLYMGRQNLPSEEEQYESYRDIAQAIDGEVIIRTLDIGGDKNLPYLNFPKEDNPFLGWRAIRVSLESENMFKVQLRAILRASESGNVKILYPLISSVDEMKRCRVLVEEVKSELRSENIPFSENIEQGALIEVPAAVEIMDLLADEVDFFSIGTNDLIQFSLGVDRANDRISKLYDPLHPGVLRLLKRIIVTAHKFKKPIGMCGEMAMNPEATVILIGLGLRNLSMSGPSIPIIKRLIRKLSYKEARKHAETCLKLASSEAIRNYLKPIMEQIFSED
jgi:phosphotransferase system enzyme I (PtsI)